MTFGPGKVESAIARVEALPDASARQAAREAVAAVLEFHGEAVRRLSGRLREASAEGERLLRAAAQDEVVAALLALHEVHAPGEPPEARARRAQGLIQIGPLPGKRQAAHERCELCSEALPPDHGHLFDVERRKLTCACTACSMLFDSNGKSLRRVRRTARRLEPFQITGAQWEALKVPVGLAFFSRSSALDAVVAAYPGPAGAIEATVSAGAWEALVESNPALAALERDTEALLVHRAGAPPRYYVLSIDECYRLTGLVRSRWQGLTGGDGPTRAIEEFFASLGEDRP